jgi:hypothetical protein
MQLTATKKKLESQTRFIIPVQLALAGHFISFFFDKSVYFLYIERQ